VCGNRACGPTKRYKVTRMSVWLRCVNSTFAPKRIYLLRQGVAAADLADPQLAWALGSSAGVWHVGVSTRKQHYLLIPHNGCHLAHQLWALIYGGICQLTMCSSRNPSPFTYSPTYFPFPKPAGYVKWNQTKS